MRRKLTIAVVAVLSLMLVAGAAWAQEERHSDRPGRSIWASGDGTVEASVEAGGMKLFVVGDVSISGPADLNIEIESFETTGLLAPEAGGTEVELTGFSGSVFVRGSDYTVEIDGHVTLHGHGRGEISLDGSGLWKTRTSQGVWPETLGFDT